MLWLCRVRPPGVPVPSWAIDATPLGRRVVRQSSVQWSLGGRLRAGFDVAIAFDARDAAGLFQFSQSVLQCLLLIPRETELLEKFRDV